MTTPQLPAVMAAAPSERIELGCPGHFIAASSCRWRRHTQVGGYRISSVGDYFPGTRGGERETIGAGDRDFFETYVFKTAPSLALGNEGCGCREVLLFSEIDGERYATAGEAQAGHERYIEKYAALSTESPAPAAPSAEPVAWYRTFNGVNMGVSFERTRPDLPGWVEHPLVDATPAVAPAAAPQEAPSELPAKLEGIAWDGTDYATGWNKAIDACRALASRPPAEKPGEDAVRGALAELCKYFPTDSDMIDLDWEKPYIDAACNAYDRARTALDQTKGEK